jgi:hypothetical protein
LNAVKYRVDILDPIVLPFLQQWNSDHVFQHDNARCQVARKHYRRCVTHNIPQAFIHRLIGSMRRKCEAVVAARGGHTRYWTPQTSILHDNFYLSMICSDNDIEQFCWYCLICYAHLNLNYTIFVNFFSLCKKY